MFDSSETRICADHSRYSGAGKDPDQFHVPTEQNDDARQDGYQRPGAEAGGQHVGLHVAGEDGVSAVTGTHPDGQRVGAGHGRDAVVVYLDGEEVNVLGQAAESFPQHVDAGRAVCREVWVKGGEHQSPESFHEV